MCIFCKIANKEIDSNIVYETDNFIAFLDINPVNPGHTLIIPKKHYEHIIEMPEEYGIELMNVIKKVANAVKKAVNADGFNIAMNNGEAAGQVVMHAHIHIIPRFKGDGLKPWPQRKADSNELRGIAEDIKREIHEG